MRRPYRHRIIKAIGLSQALALGSCQDEAGRFAGRAHELRDWIAPITAEEERTINRIMDQTTLAADVLFRWSPDSSGKNHKTGE